MRIGDIDLGDGAPLALISGLNVIENLDATLRGAAGVQGVAERHGLPVVFKASFDKANRSSRHSYRGPGIDQGLRVLADVKREIQAGKRAFAAAAGACRRHRTDVRWCRPVRQNVRGQCSASASARSTSSSACRSGASGL